MLSMRFVNKITTRVLGAQIYHNT